MIIKIVKTTETIIMVKPDNQISILSDKVVNTNISTIPEDTYKITVKYQFNVSEVKYGIIVFDKENPFRTLYVPNGKINVSINGSTLQAKWHSAREGRIDGLTKLFSKIGDLEARVFKLSYDKDSNTLVFEEI